MTEKRMLSILALAGLALLVPAGADAAAPTNALTLTVREGKLYRDGKPFRAFGLNVRDLADDVLDKGLEAKESFACIRWLGEKKVPFIRFWGSYFNDRRKYLENPERYWRNMDLLVEACEKANVGLAPTLFWDSWGVCFVFDEYACDWADDQSQTRRFAERYTREFVTRYRSRPIFWFWEFSNENNLGWDLPNAMEFLPEKQRDARNIARYYVGRLAIRAFAEEVRRHDPSRPISSGCSSPRPSQFHLATTAPGQGSPWAADSFEQTATAASWTAPAPVDLLSIHYYEPFASYDAARVRRDLASSAEIAGRLKRALYLGEFGVLDDTKLDDKFDDALYRQRARDLFEAIYEVKTPLAAWWVYAVKPWGFAMGAVNPEFKRFDYVTDLIREYNEKTAASN